MFEFIDKIKDKYRQNRVEKLLNVQKSLNEIEERIDVLFNEKVAFTDQSLDVMTKSDNAFEKASMFDELVDYKKNFISELANLKLNKNKLLKSEQSLKKEDPLFKSMYDHMRFEATYKEVTKGYRQGQISLEKCDEILKAINNDKRVKYSDNLVFNTEGKLLLLKRSELDKTFPGMYTIPGGHVDAGEDHRTAAIRELQEESGLTPDKDSQFTKVGEYEDDKVCIEYFLSYVDNDSDTLCLQSEEAWQYEWVESKELDKYEFPLNMKQNIQKILFPQKEVIQKLGKALRNKEITKSQFIQLYKAINHKYIDKKLNKFGNFYYIYKENENSFNDGKEKENSTRIIEDSGTTIISNSIQGSPEEYKGERKASWQLNKLREEAEKKGFLEDELQNLKIQSEKVLRGTEAQVLFVKSDDDNMDVLKAFDPISHLSPKETLDDFVDRINLYNEYFSETSLYFRGLSNDKSKVTILFSQKYVDGNVLKLPDPPAFESFNEAKIRLKEEDKLYKQVALELKKRYGFIPIGKEKTKYTNGKVTIQDVHLGNVMKGTDGKLYFIDLDISKNEDAIQKLGKAYKSGKITREKFMQALDVLSKSFSHKYISKKPDGKGGWEYEYEEDKNDTKRYKSEVNSLGQKLGKTKEEIASFWQWFGDSKVVDKNGNPLVVFRGKSSSTSKIKSDNPYYISGLWFAAPSDDEDNYEEGNAEWVAEQFSDNGEIEKVYLKIENPKIYNDYEDLVDEIERKGGIDKFYESFKKKDGLHLIGSMTDGDVYRDDYVVFNKDQIKVIKDETQKSLQSINELYLQNKLSDELYEKIIEKAWKKSPIGTITTRSNGQKWKKVSETGNKDQDWQLVSKPKTGNKTDSPVSKEKRSEYGTKGKQPTISEHAKQSSETALNAAIKESQDPEVREAAHQELDRRQKEEHVQEEEKKDGGEKKEANKHVEKFRQLSDDQIKFYLDAPYPEVKEAAKMVADERGLSVVSKEDYIKSFEDFDENPETNEDYFYKNDSRKSFDYLEKNEDISSSLSSYKFDGFLTIREYLSNTDSFSKENEYLVDKLKKDTDNISKFIKDNPLSKNLTLHRRCLSDSTFFTKLKENDIYEDKSFSSTSLQQRAEFGDFHIKILAKSGSRVSNINNKREFEYLIDKGSKFRVIEKHENGLGITVELL